MTAKNLLAGAGFEVAATSAAVKLSTPFLSCVARIVILLGDLCGKVRLFD